MKLKYAIRGLILASAAPIAVMATPVFAQSSEMSHLGIPVDRIGLVAFTIRDQIAADARGAVEAVAACGIPNIEFSFSNFDGGVASFQGIPVSDIVTMSSELGFAVPSLGVSGADLTDRLDQVIAAAQAVGASYVRISGARPAEGATQTEAEYLAFAEILNNAGGPLNEAGIMPLYHNHGWEFEALADGRTGMDVLFAETNPETVGFELDLYWTEVGGGNALDLIAANPGRFPAFHVKDAQTVTTDGVETTTFATVGQGFIDFGTILAQAEVAGAEYFFIENDQPQPDGITSACESYAYITGTP
ncbi:sugar phosphate isomerase/epimerase family protein [Ketogulonicigenium vulgare]|uniref:AP endonuclease, family 2 n=1 Tax=Ketogulonicigenium vulgare (strain WSH-001) TaxID=759362 RepID=F9YB61_KETVW|nr:sugar phosphate isomerase/epimerase [Ketogulonicigenium vulgare]ADO44090.1 Xylose isomerase domain protein TIM barrel [Ketogulonicigenium vulgare Y25]AEM42613.1 AP endonuclease, family 2 [Ketogulonicigenium vulgare WSH-001]ALJ82638.1 AP endonuclease [Ketogulonicigenium vulgare]AOZ53315.1 Xylose isomerase domain protein TIM barrel [Ketogulonicigenium vulgare]